MGGIHKDLTGEKFGRLLVSSQCENLGKRRGWLCICDCGNSYKVITNSLLSGKTTSCGCWRRDNGIEIGKKYGFAPRHGLTNTKAWNAWSSMIERTSLTTRDSTLKNYGARGISVCERWSKFENFFEDMGHPPSGKSLDRIDVNKGYEPGNCRWATAKQQMNNRTNTRYLIIDGIKRPLMDLADEIGIKKSAAQYFFSTYKVLLERFGSVQIEGMKNEFMG